MSQPAKKAIQGNGGAAAAEKARKASEKANKEAREQNLKKTVAEAWAVQRRQATAAVAQSKRKLDEVLADSSAWGQLDMNNSDDESDTASSDGIESDLDSDSDKSPGPGDSSGGALVQKKKVLQSKVCR